MAIPENNMIVVAVMLAILENFTSMLGKLNFIWATTVLLGGFASYLVRKDFWYVSVILVAEGIRIFGRRGELDISSSIWNITMSYYSIVIQECSALICLYLSTAHLRSAEYSPSDQARNGNVALKLFYWVSTVESCLILLGLFLRFFSRTPPLGWHGEEKAVWMNRWVLEVKEGYHLHDSQITILCSFIHNTYSRCVSGSIFDTSKITIVSYSVELLQSSNGDEQLKGARLLSALVKDNPRALERLRSIETIRGVVEMLIDMLNWDSKESPDKRIRVAAAESIQSLVQYIGRNRTLVMAAPNSMESIASLLDDRDQVENQDSSLSEVGLRILKHLANDHDNRAKMGSNRGLLLKIITLTESTELHLKMPAIETLTSIARDQDFREIIGCIDGVLHNIFSLFLMKVTVGNEELVSKAGEALGFLSFDNNQNCEIMKSIRRAYFRNLIPRLISLLNDEGRGTYAARILRNLSAYLEAYPEANSVELNMIGAAAAQVVDLVTEKEGVHQEAAIGLAAQIFNFLSQADYDPRARSLISTLLDVLRQHASRELPNIRRFSILLLIAIMRKYKRTVARGSPLEMVLRNDLNGVMNTSVLESYSTFSGTIGLRSDSMAIPFLAQSAIGLLDNADLLDN